MVIVHISRNAGIDGGFSPCCYETCIMDKGTEKGVLHRHQGKWIPYNMGAAPVILEAVRRSPKLVGIGRK